MLACSGGLDTSIKLKWLQETYQCEVASFTADLGKGAELEPALEGVESYRSTKKGPFFGIAGEGMNGLRSGCVGSVAAKNKNDPKPRGGSICLNSFEPFRKWISRSVMPRPGLAGAC